MSGDDTYPGKSVEEEPFLPREKVKKGARTVASGLGLRHRFCVPLAGVGMLGQVRVG